MQSSIHRVVIVGGGFGGLNAARKLARTGVDVTLIDRRNHHLFQPLLYQVATGSLSPAHIASPLRHVLRRARNVRVILGDVIDVDVEKHVVQLTDVAFSYDTLILAAGSRPYYFGHDEWEQRAPALKSIRDATRIRGELLSAFEHAELERDPARRRALMTFVIVGGGPTGVELAGALAELAKDTLKNEFRDIDSRTTRIVLIEGSERLLAAYPPVLSERAQHALEHLGVEVWTTALVTEIQPTTVRVKRGSEEAAIDSANVVWAAGVRPSELGEILARGAGVELDRAGRIKVGRDFSVPGHPEILVIGDLAHYETDDGATLPGLAPVAMQSGSYVGKLVLARLRAKRLRPFRYVDKGNMAVIGRSRAVADIRGRRFSGTLAWLLWLFVHLMYLVGFANRVLVFFQWAWSYATRNRTACLITRERAEQD